MDTLMAARFSDIVSDRTRAAGMLLLVYFPEEDFERPRLSVFDARWSKRDLAEACEAGSIRPSPNEDLRAYGKSARRNDFA
jgi:hypothetical protein